MHPLLQLLSPLLIVVVIIIFLVLLFFRYDYTWLLRSEDVKAIDRIPGPKPLPYFGNMLIFNRPHEEIIQELMKLHRQHGAICRIWVIGIPAIFLEDPDDIEVLLSSSSHITKSTIYEFLMPWLCTGLLISGGEKWHYRRKVLTPTFHFKILEQYIQVFNNESAVLVKLLEAKLDHPYVVINDMIRKCTLDIICEAALGVAVHAQTGGNDEYVNAVKRITELIVNRMTSPWLYRYFVYRLSPGGREQRKLLKILHGFTEKIIRNRKEEYRQRKNNEKGLTDRRKRLAFLDLLLEVSENEGTLTDKDIREEVDTFVFEGHDTTSVALMWALLLLGAHPEVQDKAAAELREIFGDSTREATFDDLQKMVYLEMVIKESLRLYPSVPGVARILGCDVTLKGYRIPAGAEMVVAMAAIHRNPKVFPNPNSFNPDRFLPENAKNRHPFSYIPFSAGPRNCIGQRFGLLEEKVVLSAILRKFTIESLDKPEDIPAMYELIYRPKFDIKLKFSLRQNRVKTAVTQEGKEFIFRM